MTKEGLQKALGQLFDVAKGDPLIHLKFDKSLLDTIERLEKEGQSPLRTEDSD